MTLPIVRSTAYAEDLIAIWTHVAWDSVEAADRLVERINAIIGRLAAKPALEMHQFPDGLRGRRQTPTTE
ncbi:hypothetical protein Mal64_22120 [Pseudobythopirellula maris]|uniref:Plasmid stabilization system protein n=1 Tax=Pseudobythopirellula maris TaxID=2527991 RepID=A0A5C5ZML7_9BACT|nr:hypothetical protein Mal64_22120 [Pseudobythopirellula maris]